jgi:hypothetical protein
MCRTLVLVVTLLALVAGRAYAAVQNPALNATASAVAGHPVIVSCATSSSEWAAFEATAGYAAEVDGFTFAARDNVIYLGPRVCQTLLALVTPNSHGDVGPYWAALAIKTIIHESVHQRGVLDEAVTDCTALSLLTQYAVSSFGYPATIKTFVYTKTKLGTFKRRNATVPNPELARLAYWAEQWHLAMPANYQGGC